MRTACSAQLIGITRFTRQTLELEQRGCLTALLEGLPLESIAITDGNGRVINLLGVQQAIDAHDSGHGAVLARLGFKIDVASEGHTLA